MTSPTSIYSLKDSDNTLATHLVSRYVDNSLSSARYSAIAAIVFSILLAGIVVAGTRVNLTWITIRMSIAPPLFIFFAPPFMIACVSCVANYLVAKKMKAQFSKNINEVDIGFANWIRKELNYQKDHEEEKQNILQKDHEEEKQNILQKDHEEEKQNILINLTKQEELSPKSINNNKKISRAQTMAVVITALLFIGCLALTFHAVHKSNILASRSFTRWDTLSIVSALGIYLTLIAGLSTCALLESKKQGFDRGAYELYFAG